MSVELKDEYSILHEDETIFIRQFYENDKPTGIWAYETSSDIGSSGQGNAADAERDAKAIIEAYKADKAAAG